MSSARRVHWTQHEDDNVYDGNSSAIPHEVRDSLPVDSKHGALQPPDIHNDVQSWASQASQYQHNTASFDATQNDPDDSEAEDEDSSNELDDDEAAFYQLYTSNQAAADPAMAHERLEWWQMLNSALNGEVIKYEMKKLSSTDNISQEKAAQEIWLSLRALLRGRTIAQEHKYLEDTRKEIDKVIDAVLEFKMDSGSCKAALERVADLHKFVDRVESLYPKGKDLRIEHPRYCEAPFQDRLNALNAWGAITRSLYLQHSILSKWTGSEDLHVAGNPESEPENLEPFDAGISPYQHIQRTESSFVERLLKESALKDTFDKRTLSALNSLLLKSKQTMMLYNSHFEAMNLPSYIPLVRQLSYFPISLVQEALRQRLPYKDRMNEPPKKVVDAMMDDCRSLISLACRVKNQYEELAHTENGWNLEVDPENGRNYERVLMESVEFYFKLIKHKLRVEKENNLRECEVIEKEWEFLRATVCKSVPDADWTCAEQFCAMTNGLLSDVISDYRSSLKVAPEAGDGGLEAKYTKLLHTTRMRARKLVNFAKRFMSQFENAAEYSLDNRIAPAVTQRLISSGHFLVWTDSFERNHMYIIASPSLYGRNKMIQSLVRACFAHSTEPTTPGVPGQGKKPEDYILVLSPSQDVVWTGDVEHINIPLVQLGIRPQRFRLVASDGSRVSDAKAYFEQALVGSGSEQPLELRANIPLINRELRKIHRSVFNLAEEAISSVATIRRQTEGLGCQELVQECFSFASSFQKQTVTFLSRAGVFNTGTRAPPVDANLARLAIDWICFITEDCNPSDHKTFRWAVSALQFARDANILALNETEFVTLQSKVAQCIALLISHFDVLGTKWTYELQLKEEQRRRRGVTAKQGSLLSMKRMTDDDVIATSSAFGLSADVATASGGVAIMREEWMQKISELESKRSLEEQERKVVGKVLDDQKPEDQSLVYLAPSSSNISFRWQQGGYIGSGTFGSVYLAVNLDTSSPMAVKEIRFPDSSALSTLHRAIKEEMKVMEMLHHSNIVQYYGMEVHRDKVYIFMEYCEQGSLGSLLDHGGRIEDEDYIVEYTYQLLNGLAYLHENNIVHRDIKPDNILLDDKGQVKLSDFGAAKILAKGQKTLGRTTMNRNVNSLAGTAMYMAPEVITGGDAGRKGSMDIWSLGCCIVQMATGRRPWSTLENEWAIMYHVVTGLLPLPESSQMSDKGIEFLKRCFTRNAAKRPSATELLNDPWIQDYLQGYQIAGVVTGVGSVGSIRSTGPPMTRSISQGSVSHGAQVQAFFRDMATSAENDQTVSLFPAPSTSTRSIRSVQSDDTSPAPGTPSVPSRSDDPTGDAN